MAAVVYLACLISLFLMISEAVKTRAEITTPINPVTLGGVLTELKNMEYA